MEQKTVVCIGAALIDETYTCISVPLKGTSNPATYQLSQGGVACNVATHLSQLGNRVELITRFGNDGDGNWLRDQCTAAKINITNAIIDETVTGKYAAILYPDGNLFSAASSCDFEAITPEFLKDLSPVLLSANLIFVECNLSTKTLQFITAYCADNKIPCIIEPVSVSKAQKINKCNLQNVLLVTPNSDELTSLCESKASMTCEEFILQKGVKHLWVRMGAKGSDLFSSEGKIHLDAPAVVIEDETGAGDAALAGWIHGWLQNKNLTDCMKYGHALASVILRSKGAILKILNRELLEKNFNAL